MTRLALGVEYDGSGFRGWQSQNRNCGMRTVQAELERALAQVAAAPVSVVCAGRTDAGVHASAQVVHFDAPNERPERAWTLGVNSRLADDISVAWVRPVGDDFHARFSATGRRYRYLIHNRPLRSALWHQRAAWVYRPLDAEAMHGAGQALLGEHDFSAFRAAGCQSRSPWRNLYALSVSRSGELVGVEVEANAFLHHMVRNIVGVLLAVGSGERPAEWPAEVLAGRDRRRAGVTAPAQGLTLTAVRYPPRCGLHEVDKNDAGRYGMF